MIGKTNPFRPGAGRRPPYLAGRGKEQGRLRTALETAIVDGEGETIVMYGPRGAGKTALLNWFARACDDRAGAVAMKTTPSTGLGSMRALAELLLPRGWLPGEMSIDLAGLFSAGWTRPKTKIHGRLVEHLIDACRRKPRLLLVDEAHTLDPGICQSLLNIAQDVSSTAPFLLVLAGTPGLEPLLMSVDATFVERSPKLPIGRLDERAAADAIAVPLERTGVSIDPDALDRVVADSQGYPYFLQLWGEALWNGAAERDVRRLAGADVDGAMPSIADRREHFYRTRYNAMGRDGSLLDAADAVARAFRGRSMLPSDAIADIIERNLPDSLDGGEARRKTAAELGEALHRLDFVWEPGAAAQVEPGIPSFMTYVRERMASARQPMTDPSAVE